ncbi:MAG: hypothetical protein Q7R45_08295 [Sulfuricaulis sp.]|nr:hypothetical protein [Sulfuricaulis sp.]
MTTAFRPATRSEAKPMIGLYSESGNGKTWGSLLLARGFVGPHGKIGMIETEGGRGEVNVGREPVGQYLVRPIRGNFSPTEYGKAISDAEEAKLDALIIDSASHEWESDGGVLAMAAENQAKGMKGVLVWQKPKIDHQRHFMLRLMQTPIPLVIVCMRAKYPMEKKGNDWARSEKLDPKQADDILFEMFVHGWIDQQHKLHVTKYTLPELATVIRDNEAITIETGQRLSAWAKGETTSLLPRTAASASAPAQSAAPPAPAGADEPLSDLLTMLDASLADAATRGTAALLDEWKSIHPKYQATLKSALDRRHKVTAQAADRLAPDKQGETQ